MKHKFLISIMCLAMIFSIMKPTNDVNAEGRADGANTTISVGSRSSFAIQPDGSLWAWGNNFYGKLGDGTTTSRRTPVKVMDNVATVSAAINHTAAVTNDGILWVWGRSSFGCLCEDTGEYEAFWHIEPMKIAENVAVVSAGSGYTMFITNDGYLWGWGRNNRGQLGDGTTVNRETPVQIMDNVVAVSAASSHTAAINADGYLWAWGSNVSGQLGDGTTIERHAPVKIMKDVTAVYAGSGLTSAITSDGVLWSWGRNSFMENADETIDPFYILNKEPMQIAENVIAVSSTTFITSDGGLWFWGMGSARSINSFEFSFGAIMYESDVWGEFIEIPWQPQPVRIMDNIIAIAAASHIIVITSDNELWGWGNNLDHQIGIGSSIIDVDSPVRIMDSVMIHSNTSASLPPTCKQLIAIFTIGNLEFISHDEILTNDVAPFIDGDRTMVPLRAIMYTLGATVEWIDSPRSVEIRHGDTALTLAIDVPLPDNMGTPVIINDRTFVPLRYVTETFGAHAEWDGVNQSARIYQ